MSREEAKRLASERQRRYHARMRAEGLTRMGFWVPEDRKDQVTAVMENLRRGWIADGVYPDGDS